MVQLKLIDRLRVTCLVPPDYWQTDNSNELVMVIRNYHRLNSASRVLISTCSAPLVQTGEQFFTVWPWPLTYNPRLAKVKVYPHAKNQGQGSNNSNRRVPTDKWMDTHTDTTIRISSPATRSITSDIRASPCTYVSEWVSSFLTAHQHIIGYSVPWRGRERIE